MALKDIWVDLKDKVAGVPDSGSELTVKPINDIAHSVIENEEKIKEVDGAIENVNDELGNINNSIGETETALDMIVSQQESIIAIQEELIGGDVE